MSMGSSGRALRYRTQEKEIRVLASLLPNSDEFPLELRLSATWVY